MDGTTTSTTTLNIPLARCIPSPRNGRKHLGDLTSIAASLDAEGQLQPGLVRPLNGNYEIVFGHRRHAALALNGAPTFRAEVRDLDGKTALLMQITENRERENVHPLDEADGIVRLLDEHGMSIAEVAAELGCSMNKVRQRRVLAGLSSAARKAFAGGAFTTAVALHLAPLPDTVQAKAVKEIGRHDRTTREALAIIEHDYMLDLSRAPWKLDDADLIGEAGSCTTCPKRTGNQGDLFDSAPEKDLCTDGACFAAKGKRHGELVVLRAKADGLEVLQGKAAQGVVCMGFDGRPQVSSYNHVSLDDTAHSIGTGKKTWRKLLGADAPKPTVVVTGTGHVVEVVKRADVEKAAKNLLLVKASVTGAAAKKESSPAQREKEKRAKLVDAKAVELSLLTVADLVGKKPTRDIIEAFIWVAASVASSGNEAMAKKAAAAFGIDGKNLRDSLDAPDRDVREALVVILVGALGWHADIESTRDTFEALGVDVDDAIARAGAAVPVVEVKAKKKAPPAKASKKGAREEEARCLSDI